MILTRVGHNITLMKELASIQCMCNNTSILQPHKILLTLMPNSSILHNIAYSTCIKYMYFVHFTQDEHYT